MGARLMILVLRSCSDPAPIVMVRLIPIGLACIKKAKLSRANIVILLLSPTDNSINNQPKSENYEIEIPI